MRRIGVDRVRAQWERLARGRARSNRPYDVSGTEQVRHRPTIEESTGLLNRAGMRHLLGRWVDASPDTAPVAVAYIEVDGMEFLSNVRGPESADDIVYGVARQLHQLRGGDTGVGRLGTWEFVVARRLDGDRDELTDTAALDVLDREIHDSLRRVSSAGQHVPRASVGLTVGDLTEVRQPWSVVHMAADLSREASRRGGNGTIREGHGVGRRMRRRDDIAVAMHSAVAGRELRLVFHPIVELSGHAPVAAEALLRWNSKDLGSISPTEFIPLMENHRSMRLVDDWVVDRALDGLLAHSSSKVSVSINVSPLSLQDDGYAAALLARLERVGVEPSRLWLEVTETALSSRPEQLLQTLAELRSSGIRILLDDFGAGYSSLTTLADLPVDWIKLDGRLVVGARDNERRRQVLEFAAKLGRSLGHAVVAEHIETPEDEQLARSAGCTHGQGYLYTVPTADFSNAMLAVS